MEGSCVGPLEKVGLAHNDDRCLVLSIGHKANSRHLPAPNSALSHHRRRVLRFDPILSCTSSPPSLATSERDNDTDFCWHGATLQRSTNG